MRKPLRCHICGGGGDSRSLELIAGIFTQFSQASRNKKIAIVAALAILLALLALPVQAQSTTTAQVVGFTSLPEGGLVAQQVGDCPAKPREIPVKNSSETVADWYQRVIAYLDANKYNRNYCEFRDDGSSSYTELTVTFHNYVANVQYKAQLPLSSRLKLEGTSNRESTIYNPNQAGAKHTVKFKVRGKANFAIDGSATETINILGDGGAVIGSFRMTIVDDDDSTYIGQRRRHPYGGSWNRQPHCYGAINCAFD